MMAIISPTEQFLINVILSASPANTVLLIVLPVLMVKYSAITVVLFVETLLISAKSVLQTLASSAIWLTISSTKLIVVHFVQASDVHHVIIQTHPFVSNAEVPLIPWLTDSVNHQQILFQSLSIPTVETK